MAAKTQNEILVVGSFARSIASSLAGASHRIEPGGRRPGNDQERSRRIGRDREGSGEVSKDRTAIEKNRDEFGTMEEDRREIGSATGRDRT